MNSFDKKYAKFLEVERHYDALIQDLENQQHELEKKLLQDEINYERSIRQDLEENSKQTKSEVSRIAALNDRHRSELNNIRVRLDVARQMKAEKLQDLLPGLKQEKDKLVSEAQKELEQITSEALQRKAEYLLYIASLKGPRQNATDATSKLQQAARKAGVNDYSRERVSMRNLNLVTPFGMFGEMPLAPTDQEIIEAYRLGKLPAYVRWYVKTGEIIREQDAAVRLREAR